jgi:hypothetical protein
MTIQIDTKTNKAALNFLKREHGQLAWVMSQGNDFLEALAGHVAKNGDFPQEDFEDEMVRLLDMYPECFVTYFVRNLIGDNPAAHILGRDDEGFIYSRSSTAN